MFNPFANSEHALPLYPVHANDLEQWLGELPGKQKQWLLASGFTAKPGQLCSLADAEGELAGFVFGMQDKGFLYQLAELPEKLPAGAYSLQSQWTAEQRLQASLGWGLACYSFDRYR